jgi:hypothetical protein
MLNVLDIVAYLAANFTSSESDNRQELAAALRTVSVAEVLSMCCMTHKNLAV